MAKEFERAGLPTAFITTIVPLAQNIGPNRIIAGRAVPHPLGEPSLGAVAEKELRRRLVRRALDALQADSPDQLVLRIDDPTAGAELAPA
jgi:betaine reductase